MAGKPKRMSQIKQLLKLSINYLLSLEDPVLEAKFHPGSPAYADERFEGLKSRLGYFTKELGRNGVTRKLLWEEYRQQDYRLITIKYA